MATFPTIFDLTVPTVVIGTPEALDVGAWLTSHGVTSSGIVLHVESSDRSRLVVSFEDVGLTAQLKGISVRDGNEAIFGSMESVVDIRVTLLDTNDSTSVGYSVPVTVRMEETPNPQSETPLADRALRSPFLYVGDTITYDIDILIGLGVSATVRLGGQSFVSSVQNTSENSYTFTGVSAGVQNIEIESPEKRFDFTITVLDVPDDVSNNKLQMVELQGGISRTYNLLNYSWAVDDVFDDVSEIDSYSVQIGFEEERNLTVSVVNHILTAVGLTSGEGEFSVLVSYEDGDREDEELLVNYIVSRGDSERPFPEIKTYLNNYTTEGKVLPVYLSKGDVIDEYPNAIPPVPSVPESDEFVLLAQMDGVISRVSKRENVVVIQGVDMGVIEEQNVPVIDGNIGGEGGRYNRVFSFLGKFPNGLRFD